MRNRRTLTLLFIALLVLGISIAFTTTSNEPNDTPATSSSPTPSPIPDKLPETDTAEVATPDIQSDIVTVPAEPPLMEQQQGQLRVKVIDVKHGDCTLVISPNGKTMLIDTGEGDQQRAVRKALEQAGVERIDVLQLTHPHSDHIGNAPWILRNYPVGEVHMIDKAHTTKMYDNLLDALEEVSPPVKMIKPGFTFDFDGVQCEYIGPLKTTYSGLNDCSAIMRMTYGQKSFLFTGDLEVTGEKDISSKYGDALKCDFLKVGHHATNSTEEAFVQLVRPEISVISSKPLRSYTHPERKQAVADRLAAVGSKVYITGSNGSVTVFCDGATMKVEYEHEPDSVDMEMTIQEPSPAIPIETTPLSKTPPHKTGVSFSGNLLLGRGAGNARAV